MGAANRTGHSGSDATEKGDINEMDTFVSNNSKMLDLGGHIDG